MTAPMFDNKYLAHALGGYNGYKYLNNEAALKNSIRQGHRFFEVDLTLTKDGHLVPSYGWNKRRCNIIGLEYSPEFANMTKELFLQQSLHGMPMMDTETLYRYMKAHPDFYWELDLHARRQESPEKLREDAAKLIEALVEDFHHDHDLFDHFLIQANSHEMFEGIDSVFHFKYYQLFVPKDVDHEGLCEAIDYCRQNGFCSIALSALDANEKTISLIKDNGLNVLIYSLDDQKKADRLHALGADTICTNVLSPRNDRIIKLKKAPPVRVLRRIYKKVRRLFS